MRKNNMFELKYIFHQTELSVGWRSFVLLTENLVWNICLVVVCFIFIFQNSNRVRSKFMSFYYHARPATLALFAEEKTLGNHMCPCIVNIFHIQRNTI